MSQVITPSGKKFILGILVLGMIGLAWVYLFGPAAQQQRGLALAHQHADSHAALIREISADPRFKFVSFSITTWDNGGFLFSGDVATEADLGKLKQIWASSHPPVETHYKVTVLPEPDFSMAHHR